MPDRAHSPHDTDWSLLEAELRAAAAYVDGLRAANVLTASEHAQIHAALTQIDQEQAAEALPIGDPFDTIDQRLGTLLGGLAGKLQSGRSRPERLLTALRVWLIEQIEAMGASIAGLQRALLQQAEGGVGALMPGYAHYQPTQIIAAGHWLLAGFWALSRDQERLIDCIGRTSRSPLGSGLLSGTPYPIDRHALAVAIGLTDSIPNSLDATTDWDFAIDFLSAASLLGIHIGRLAEDLFWFASPPLGFVSFDSATALALNKAKALSSSLLGDLTGAFSLIKGLSSAYHRETAEMRYAIYDAVDRTANLIPALTDAIDALELHADRMWDALDERVLIGDLIDYLTARGVPNDQAGQVVERLAARAEQEGVPISELPIDDFQAESPAFDAEVYAALDFSRTAAQHSAEGGIAPSALRQQIRQANAWLVDNGFRVALFQQEFLIPTALETNTSDVKMVCNKITEFCLDHQT